MKRSLWIALAVVPGLLVINSCVGGPRGVETVRATPGTIVYLPTLTGPAQVLGPGLCSGEPPPLVTDQEIYQIPQMAEPAARVPFRDPVFGTCLVRVTDRQADIAPDDSSPGLKNEYSRVQSFNADGSNILVRGIEATWYLYDNATLLPIAKMPFDGSLDPRWDATDPDVLYYTDAIRLMSCNVRSGETSLVHDFEEDFAGQLLAAVWTRHEGSPSADGRYWGLMAENQDWERIALLVYDQQADEVIAKRDLNTRPEIDNVTMSPLGSYLIACYDDYCERGELGDDANPCGLMVYDRDLRNGRALLRIVGHCDAALDADGREVLVYQDIDTDHISMVDLETGQITPLWAIDFSHTAIGRVVRLAHTHSVVDETMEHDYWAEPHASVNQDFTRVVFTSNWGRSGTEEVEMYLLE
ncbi:MAG TPA: hypothetical protein VM366_12885, partial [Anaerolineae bacterium]|nr:hypothetical protein [Anaerolineae bacterium]